MVRRQRFIYGKSSYGHRNNSGVTGIVPGPPEGFRGSTGRVHLPRRALWFEYGGKPTPRWAGHHLPLGPMRLGFGGTPKGGAPLLGGQAPSPLVAAPPLDLI